MGVLLFARLRSSSVSVVATESYVTRAGQRARVILAQGIQVTLAPRTTLHVNGAVATLTGEAFFTVPHHTQDPVIVRTGFVTTRVLGTAFDVRRYPHDATTRIVVAEGRVTTGRMRMVTLSANTVAQVGDSVVTIAPATNVMSLIGWTTGRLVFHDASVADVLAVVSRWYGVRFSLSDSTLLQHTVTAAIDMHHSRAETLALLTSVLETDLTAVGDTITLAPRQTQASHAPSRRTTHTSFPLPMEIGR